MKNAGLILVLGAAALISGCDRQSGSAGMSPSFMFWCYRDEVVSSDYHIPDMTTPAAATYLQNIMKTVPGFESSRCDLQKRTLTISYQSSTVRKMNFEEAIALSGFSVNGRPANPKANVPEGVKP